MVRDFLRKHARVLSVVVLCLAVILPTVILNSSAVKAEGGTFPGEPFNGMQITYSISGATVTDTQDEEGFTTSRTLSGTLGTGELNISGTVRMGSGWDADASATVSCGDQSDQFTTNIESGYPDFNEESFSISVPIPPGATSASFSISMTGHYNAGSRGLVVSGTFSADSESVVPATQTTPQVTEDPPPGPVVDISTLPAVDLTDTKKRLMVITKVDGNPIYISADSPSLPPSQRNWVKIMPGEYSSTRGNAIYIDENWTIRTPSGAETSVMTSTGARSRFKERSWFENHPYVQARVPFSVIFGRLKEGIANFYFPKGKAGAQKYEVGLRRAVTSIKGTNFVVEVTEESDTVKVIEGEIEFIAYDSDDTVTLQSGQQVIATDDGIGEVLSLDVDEEKSKWGDYYEESGVDAATEPESVTAGSMLDGFLGWLASIGCTNSSIASE